MAEKIASLNMKLMTQDEIFGFMNDVAHQIEDTFAEKPDFTLPYLEALTAFDESLKGDDCAMSASELAEADHEADMAWWGLSTYLKAMVIHPNDVKRSAAEKIYHVFTKYENPTNLSYATEYGIMERLINDLKEIPESVMQDADALEWLEMLEEKCSTFTQMYSIRIQDKACKVTGAAKTARANATGAYREMVMMVNALLVVSPSDEINRFASHVNELIAARAAAIKTRRTKAAGDDSKLSDKIIAEAEGDAD